MKFCLLREALLKPLQLVIGVVERRQTLPVLSNVLLDVDADKLLIMGTDLEVQIVGSTQVQSSSESGKTTVPARKLLDICRSLPEDALIEFTTTDGKAKIESGRSKFTLSTLPANDFPSVDQGVDEVEFSAKAQLLKDLINATSFAMGQQDVRYYLNGVLWEVTNNQLRLVATDGHRLALSDGVCDASLEGKKSIILPRKGITELSRLLNDEEVMVSIGSNHIKVEGGGYSFTSKLIEGKYPDYSCVMPKGGDKTVIGNREELKKAFMRTAILANQEYHGVRIHLKSGSMIIVASNSEHEEALESVSVGYSGGELEIGFNVSYLSDVLNVLEGQEIRFVLSDSTSSVLIDNNVSDSSSLYVIMPMRL
jgi:DNA polymerase-3 subunit beta